MCGITGIWTRDHDQDCIRADVETAVARLRHRGPDDEGIWANGSGVALGHTRLSILDLSNSAHQPMVSRDGRYVIVFNGEIYNFREIRSRLAHIGHPFSGSGDTEVVLRAFEEWGSDAVEQFIGMFAIALWDNHEQKLELIRDRIGVKPLHFGWDGKTLCFASELKSLRAYRHWAPEMDLQALGEFLQYGYIGGGRTIYKGIQKLKPGHRLTLVKGQQPVIESYWTVLNALDRRPSGNDREIEAELEELLISSFRYRMVSDVPVGLFLSGGVDSSLMTAILARHYDQDIHTYTIGFSEDSHDESRWAKKIAGHCGTVHTEYILGVDEALEIAKDWGSLFDEPFGDPSGIPTLLVSRLAANEVKVVLSADGGDELFSGYNVYTHILSRLTLLERTPDWLRWALSSGISLLAPFISTGIPERFDVPRTRFKDSIRKLHRVRAMLDDSTSGHLMERYSSYWQPDEIAQLVQTYVSPRPSANSYPGQAATQIALWHFFHYLPEDILTKVDRTTMAVSIEGREPLLDHRLAEYAFSLPLHLRRGSLGPKHLLKSILYRYVPREFVDRPKQGFGIPLRTWLKSDLRELMTDYLSEDRIRKAGLLDAPLVTQSIRRFIAGDDTLSTPLWYLLAFEMWRDKWG